LVNQSAVSPMSGPLLGEVVVVVVVGLPEESIQRSV